MKTKKLTVDEIKPVTLESYRAQVSVDKGFLIKEKSLGRKTGVFAAKILPCKNIEFYFLYFVDGSAKSIKIGRYGNSKNHFTVAKARAEFRNLSVSYSGGVDPKVQKIEFEQKVIREREEQQEIQRIKNMQGSLEQLSEFYLEYLKKNKGQTHFNNVRKAFAKDLSNIILTKKASDVTKSDIINILHAIDSRGSHVMANRMRAYLSAMFQFGIYFDDSVEAIKHSTQFFIQSNPVTQIQKIVKNENKGTRALKEHEVRLFWCALESSEIIINRINVFKLLLLTGARVQEIAGLCWSEIDYDEKIITLSSSRTKNKLPHVIPLNEMAFSIIKNHPLQNEIYVFPAENNREALKTDGFSQALSRLLDKVNIEKFVPRDLRRTFKTLTGKAGITKDIRDRLQNHALQDVSSLHYDMYDYLSEKRAAMIVWNDYFKKMLNDEPIAL
jgi:integrase